MIGILAAKIKKEICTPEKGIMGRTSTVIGSSGYGEINQRCFQIRTRMKKKKKSIKRAGGSKQMPKPILDLKIRARVFNLYVCGLQTSSIHLSRGLFEVQIPVYNC